MVSLAWRIILAEPKCLGSAYFPIASDPCPFPESPSLTLLPEPISSSIFKSHINAVFIICLWIAEAAYFSINMWLND